MDRSSGPFINGKIVLPSSNVVMRAALAHSAKLSRANAADQQADNSDQRSRTSRDLDIITPSTAHMSPAERQACIKVMLEDLYLMARQDGCIAAAWALEVILADHPQTRDALDECFNMAFGDGQ
jgi:hypothetical protein